MRFILHAHYVVLAVVFLATACTPRGPRWAPADPMRPLVRPSFAGCELVITAADGATTSITYDELGRLVRTLRQGTEVRVEETRTWQGLCVTTFESRTISLGPGTWRDTHQACDEGGFPTHIEHLSGDVDAVGRRRITQEATVHQRNTYANDRLVQVDVLGAEREAVTAVTYEWEHERPVSRTAGSTTSSTPRSLSGWTWDRERMVTSTSGSDDPKAKRAPPTLVTNHRWSNGRYAGSVTRTDGTRSATTTYGYADGLVPTIETRHDLERDAVVVSTFDLACGR